MNKLNMIVIALAFGGMTGVVYAAKAPEVSGSMLVASADAKDVQSAGAHPNRAGYSRRPHLRREDWETDRWCRADRGPASG